MTVTLTPRPSRWDILFSFFSSAECQCSSGSISNEGGLVKSGLKCSLVSLRTPMSRRRCAAFSGE